LGVLPRLLLALGGDGELLLRRDLARRRRRRARRHIRLRLRELGANGGDLGGDRLELLLRRGEISRQPLGLGALGGVLGVQVRELVAERVDLLAEQCVLLRERRDALAELELVRRGARSSRRRRARRRRGGGRRRRR